VKRRVPAVTLGVVGGGAAGDWADGVAAVHALVVAFVAAGGLLAWWRPRLARLHLPVAGAALLVNVTGSDCPLTTVELWLRAAAGEQGYTGGFLGHYLVEPLLGRSVSAPLGAGILAVAVVPNAVAYAGLAVRCVGCRRRGPARCARVRARDGAGGRSR
jgi:hypothetical protein